jgi:palmitoyl-[glycerolipid] 3-(E)-desaturase
MPLVSPMSFRLSEWHFLWFFVFYSTIPPVPTVSTIVSVVAFAPSPVFSTVMSSQRMKTTKYNSIYDDMMMMMMRPSLNGHHHHRKKDRSHRLFLRATRASSPSPLPPQQQELDTEYALALQNFAATSSSSSSSTRSNHDTTTTTIPERQDQSIPSSMATAASAAAAAATTILTTPTTTTKSWRDDGFIYGLDGSGLQRPNGKVPVLVVEGDTLQTQPYQIVIVTVTLLHHGWYLLSSAYELLFTQYYVPSDDYYYSYYPHIIITVLQLLACTVSSWVAADFGSGILHWSVDNYGNGRTPIMGSIIAAFQGHHSAPWTITQRSFCNNVYKLCLPFGIVPVTLMVYGMGTGPLVTYWWTMFCTLEILSQEFHKWAHQVPSESPWLANTLQQMGWSIARPPHAQHHTVPFEGNYCIISGFCNPLLDRVGFFRRLEHVVYKWRGVEANAWKLDPVLRQRTLAGEYTTTQ